MKSPHVKVKIKLSLEKLTKFKLSLIVSFLEFLFLINDGVN
jgi:hypothetical protein